MFQIQNFMPSLCPYSIYQVRNVLQCWCRCPTRTFFLSKCCTSYSTRAWLDQVCTVLVFRTQSSFCWLARNMKIKAIIKYKKQVQTAEEKNLQQISQVYDQSTRTGCNINPLIFMEDLETTNLVLQQHSEEAIISVATGSHCKF